jgi:hypothetical protein
MRKLSITIPTLLLFLLCFGNDVAGQQLTKEDSLLNARDKPSGWKEDSLTKVGVKFRIMPQDKLLDIGKSTNEIEIRLAKFDMGYDTYAIISSNGKKYNAVCYIAKQPNYRRYATRKVSSPYNRYVIDHQRLDTVLSQLIQYDVTNWKDPGFRGSRVADAGIMVIQYKVKQDTGSYRFTPPSAMLLDHPDVEAYQNLAKVVEVFQAMIKEAVVQDRRKKRGKVK